MAPPPRPEPPDEPQPLWQPPPALVALVAWLRRLRRGGVELLRANPRRIGATSDASDAANGMAGARGWGGSSN